MEMGPRIATIKMPAPPLDPIIIELPNGLPAAIDPSGGTTFRVNVKPLGRNPQPNSGQLHYTTDGVNYTAIDMNVVDENIYDAVFPSFDCGALVHYYVSAQAQTGSNTAGTTFKAMASPSSSAAQAASVARSERCRKKAEATSASTMSGSKCAPPAAA